MPVSRRALLLAGVAVALSLAGLLAFCLLRPPYMADVVVYRAEGHAAATGGDLYGFTVTPWHLPATYPPFAALLFIPASWPTLHGLKIVTLVVNLALLAVVTYLSAKLAGRWTQLRSARRLPALVGATALAVWLEPVFQTLTFGQVNLAVTALVLYDLTRPDHATGKGFAIGLAAGIKLTPGFFVLYLLVTGRVRAAATALAGFLTSALVGALVLPHSSVDFWAHRMFETGRVGKVWIVDNQSLQGAVARVLHLPAPGMLWAVLALCTAVAGLYLARRLHGLGQEAWAVLCVAVTALLISPISWSHHWVWCVPLLVVAASRVRGSRRRLVLLVATAVVFSARTMWLLPHEGTQDLHFAWWEQPLAAPYPLLGLAFLAGALVTVRRHERRAVRRRTAPATAVA
ncbi:glycosyltransferase 87 family protein [Streptomyces sp. NPDC059740]|uniref:glycosyltransferase 87 family protein n=1 Tax=Streptomyces sp. NPDC059740 TaxID=3346926 RepID=UPI00364ADCF4